MIANIKYKEQVFKIDLSKPLDISIPLRAGENNPNAWNANDPKMEPVTSGEWIGSVKEGSPVNFFNILFNPHAHGTHTECVGHITKNQQSVNESLKKFFFIAEVISLKPREYDKNRMIIVNDLKKILNNKRPEAVIIRTLPNSIKKLQKKYSNTNPPFLQKEAAEFLTSIGVKHLLIDLPSVDKELDDGVLAAHHAFWNHPNETRLDCTITEFIFVRDEIKDGSYFLNLSFAPFENDASPSRPVLYKLC